MKKSKKKDKFDNKYFTRKLEMQVIQPGDGRNFPCKGNIVTVHYTANFRNGTKFDSSREREMPLSFQLGMKQVIKGWDQALLKVSFSPANFNILDVSGRKVKNLLSSQFRLWLQSCGIKGLVPGNEHLIFEIELISYM